MNLNNPVPVEQESDKSFSISTWAIQNKITVYVIIAIITIGGLLAFTSMPRESFPEVIENKVYISSVYPGNTAEDVEKFITEPIEEELRGVSGIKDIQSISFNDYGMTIVEFSDDVTLEEAKNDVKDKVDMVKADANWPTMDTGAKVEPNVFDLNIAEEFPIANINITGNYTLQQLKDFAEKLQDDFESLQAIKEAPIRGVNDKEVEVALDVYKMAAAQVSFNDIAQSISGDNKTISGGNIINQDQRLNIRVVGEIISPDDLKLIAVKETGGVTYLGDIAEINFREKDKTTYARESGEPVIMMDIKKRSGENMIDAVNEVQALIDHAKMDYLPADVKVTVTNNQAPKTENQVKDLINNIVFGVILVVGVLLFFLGLRNASFVGMAIPLSMLMSLMVLNFMGVSLNTMVLFGLVMGLGMLVDNGIVVVENVYTLMNSGYSRKEAAKQGVGEIAWPIIASTATTLAAFFPLALWPGTMGKFMMVFPMTLSVVLGSSLFVALIINSMMTSEFMHTEAEDKSEPNKRKMIISTAILGGLGILLVLSGYVFNVTILRIFGNLGIFFAIMIWVYEYILYPQSIWFQEKGLPWLEDKYRDFLHWALKRKNPVWLMVGMLLLFILSIFLLGVTQPKVLFFPENDPNQIMVYVEYPEGTDIEKTNQLTKEIEAQVAEVVDDYVVKKDGEDYNFMVESNVSQVGEGAGNPQTDAGSSAEIPHKGKITLSLREYKFRHGVDSNEVLEKIRKAVRGHAGASVTVEKNEVGPPAGYPINLEIRGKDYQAMMDEAEKMLVFIEQSGVQGLEELKIDISRDIPEMKVEVNRQLAGSMGVTNQMVGGTLRQSIYGYEVSRYRPAGDDDDYPINIRLNKKQRYDENIVFNQPLTFRNPNNGQIMQIPISAIVTKTPEKQFNKIKRQDFERTITIYSNVLGGYNPTETVNKIKEKLTHAGYTLPKGMSYKFTGEQEKQAENMNFLMTALLIAIAGIVLIIVTQFNSISKPFIIMLTVLLSFIGVFLGLIVSGDDFVIMMTMMGIISLAGIVVNNAIVLIDFTQLLINRKKKRLNIPENVMLPIADMKDSIVNGGASRLRPVLLTAITTVLGLVPLATGLNIDFEGLLSNYNPDIYMGGDNVLFWGPLAKTVIYGLVFATFLTLVVVPVLQYLINRLKFRVRYGKNAEKYPN
ncbi:Multidrug-efflux transporter MexB [Candidatus Ornithobacterium hominis]|uniref:efflux RND transporter permease subunit n=1 Tax=Candidatus Ornithobacterium hominis TaxID=2497989 RepID=UPI0024BCEC7D|nr:efflux RND transporter permease subunit [Candidatus Ornithobacterium hominis]CAI9428670.1 Multidrug-efflux transporter MexB [Candidatus Ornithobacterium hominis]